MGYLPFFGSFFYRGGGVGGGAEAHDKRGAV